MNLNQVIFVSILFNSIAASTVPQTAYCRKVESMARCADPPLMVEDEDLWCPVRLCAPSYIEAELCPTDLKTQATHKCTVKTVTDHHHRCIEGRTTGEVKLPVGCGVEVPCNGQTMTACACEQTESTKEDYMPLLPFTPNC